MFNLKEIAMRITWILMAHSSRARFLEKNEREKHLTELEDFLDAAGRATNKELRADRRQRFYGKGERDQVIPPAVSPLNMKTTCLPIRWLDV
jgi:hypothetical protein